MRLSFSTSYYCSKVQSEGPLPAIRPTLRRSKWARMESTSNHGRPKDKIIVIMGATGTGKSRLSIDLATRFFPASEIINSDKMQLYRGLDITTNKIPLPDRHGVPHHLLGDVDPAQGDLTPAQFRALAQSAISGVLSRRRVPLVVGGSNSFIHALVSARFDSESDRFDESSSVSPELHYDCCFLWVDVSFSVLYQYLLKRVDDMLDSGMFDELAEFYEPDEDSVLKRVGLRKAIGVPEFDQYFRCFPPSTHYGFGLGGGGEGGGADGGGGDGAGGSGGGTMIDTQIKMDLCRKLLFAQAVDSIKYNTCQLAKKQMRKIERLRSVGGWDLRRLNATEAFRAALSSDSGKSSEMWEKKVVQPSVKVVKRFLEW